MKTRFQVVPLLVMFLMPGHVVAGAEVPAEAKLAGMEIEEAALKLRYRPQNPQLLALQAQIKELQAIPEIRNEKYFTFMAASLAVLEKERESLAEKFRPGQLALAEADAKIVFVQKTLADRPAPSPTPEAVQP